MRRVAQSFARVFKHCPPRHWGWPHGHFLALYLELPDSVTDMACLKIGEMEGLVMHIAPCSTKRAATLLSGKLCTSRAQMGPPHTVELGPGR